MVKQLYFSFLVYGQFIWYAMSFVWDITEPDADFYIGVGCGLALSCLCTILSLNHPRVSALLGGLCLLFSAPLFIKILMAVGLTVSLITPFLLLSLIAFMIGVGCCVLILLKRKRPQEPRKIAKIAFCILPFVLLGGLMFIQYLLRFT